MTERMDRNGCTPAAVQLANRTNSLAEVFWFDIII